MMTNEQVLFQANLALGNGYDKERYTWVVRVNRGNGDYFSTSHSHYYEAVRKFNSDVAINPTARVELFNRSHTGWSLVGDSDRPEDDMLRPSRVCQQLIRWEEEGK